MECAALHTSTMCAHLPRGLQVQIPIAGILTCWCTCSLACPLHIPIGGGICKWTLDPAYGCAEKLALKTLLRRRWPTRTKYGEAPLIVHPSRHPIGTLKTTRVNWDQFDPEIASVLRWKNGCWHSKGIKIGLAGANFTKC